MEQNKALRLARQRARAKKWRQRHPKASLRLYRIKKFGLTPEAYDELVRRQEGLCAICGKPESSKRDGITKALAVDHCHKTGKIRGLLCAKHNTMLGMAEDDPSVLQKMIDYLQKHAAVPPLQ